MAALVAWHADGADVQARLPLLSTWMGQTLGDLVEVPWQRAHTVPSGTVLSTWRAAIGQAPLQALQQEALAAVRDQHRDTPT